jgi:hypothetical protein
MIFYITCEQNAREITVNLQKNDMANCYVNPLIFLSHLDFDNFNKDDLMELRFDILQNCDKLMVSGEISDDMRLEIDFAKLLKMEVMRIDEFGELQPFAE